MDKGFSLKKTKLYNLSAVLKVIMTQGPVSRASISSITKLSPTTCTATTKELIQAGVIMEVGEGESSGGRKPILLKVNKDYGCVIGVERGEGQIRCTLYNLELEEVHGVMMTDDQDMKTSFDNVAQCAKKVIADSGAKNVLGMTISTDGVVDTVSNKIIGTPLMQERRIFDLNGFFEQHFDFPVSVENDSNILAYAEKKLYYQEDHSLVHIRVGSGVGAGIIIDDQIIKGRYGYVGEIGHISMDRNGPMCFCGNKGCLETLASVNAIYNKISFGIRSGNAAVLSNLFGGEQSQYDLSVVLKAAKEGDRFAFDLINDEADMLYNAVISVINLYDPEIISISGFDLDVTRYVVDYIINKLEGTIYGYQLRNRQIVPGHQRSDMVQLGAAINSINYMFDHNVIAAMLIS